MAPPVTLGHEPYGTVIAAGPDAGAVPIGADRLVFPWIGCGGCVRCREGLDNYCMAPNMIGIQRPGGYADHLLVPHPRYLVDASGVDPVWAATLSCSGLSTYSAVSKLLPIPPDEWVAVIGAGGLGLSAIGMLRALGHERIVSVDIDDKKLNAANGAGAAATLNSRKSGAEENLKSITHGALYGAVDFVGSTETAELAARRFAQGRQANFGWLVRRRNQTVDRWHDPARCHGSRLPPRQRGGIKGRRRLGAGREDQTDSN